MQFTGRQCDLTEDSSNPLILGWREGFFLSLYLSDVFTNEYKAYKGKNTCSYNRVSQQLLDDHSIIKEWKMWEGKGFRELQNFAIYQGN